MIDIVKNKKYSFALSIMIMVIGIVFLIINGVTLTYSLEGGTQIRQMENDDYNANDVAAMITQLTGKTVSTQKLQTYNPDDADDKIDILMFRVSKEDTLTDVEINTVIDSLKENFNVKEGAEMQLESVEPFIGIEMLKHALLAIIVSFLLVMVYVWVRFKIMGGLAAAVTSVIALVHDVAFMFFVYVIFRIPLNDVFVAAILTILGYSLNDTIILYDRIRENSRLLSKLSYAELVNRSTAETISRTINTGITTLISVLTLYVFALANNIESLVNFSFPLLIGMISGIYSSVFIASPLWVIWKERTHKKVLKFKRG